MHEHTNALTEGIVPTLEKQGVHLPESTCISRQIECPVALERDQCRCKPGFFRDSKGHCTEDCSHEPCYDPNAVRKSCGIPLHCEPSCRERSPSLCETTRCVKNACECKPGFVMDFYTLLCIPASDCE
ncbi:hypothetical protein Y032_0140g2157 [Ancylostoma ceylanicum]|uniref:TIL domain-containing protein n=1 Tax=Ancylostoma ceylanicum TaxID=53326 RepID=A0A016T4E3_9BILA|nr:hypothetical protein Y032_0140g2157 [Ancylostoma ceylanicum]